MEYTIFPALLKRCMWRNLITCLHRVCGYCFLQQVALVAAALATQAVKLKLILRTSIMPILRKLHQAAMEKGRGAWKTHQSITTSALSISMATIHRMQGRMTRTRLFKIYVWAKAVDFNAMAC